MSQVSKGFLWSGVERFSLQGISFLLSIIIARIVSPSSYGLIVMIQVFLSFSQLFIDGGFANALIQKKDRTEKDYNTVFIFNFVVAVFLYSILFLTAPLISNFYNEPALIPITRVISLNLLLSSLTIVQRTRLTINLNFKTQTKVGIVSVIVSGIIGVICAYSGLEVWSLVIQSLVSQAMSSFLLIYYSHWFPKIEFSQSSFQGLFNYGSKMLANNLLTNLYLNLYNLVIGKKYSSADLAYYNRGFTLSNFPSVNISDVLNRVIFPVLTQLQDNREKMLEAYYKYLRLSHYIILPLMALVIILAEPLIFIILGNKWLPSVIYLKIFSVTYMFHAWITQSTNIIAAVGQSGIILKYQFLKRTISLILLLSTISISVEAVCWGIMANSIIELLVNLYLDKKVLNVNPVEQLKSQLDIIIVVFLSSVAVWLFLFFVKNVYMQLIGGVFIGFALYVLFTFLFNLKEKSIYIDFYIKVKSYVSK